MAKTTVVSADLTKEINFYLTMVDASESLPMNVGISSCKQETMISVLGSPLMPLTTSDQPDRASPMVTRLKQTATIGKHLVVTGIKPAITSLQAAVAQAFLQEKNNGHDFESVLSNDGMLNVRLRNPTSGKPSSLISNHSWGTAVDFKIIGHSSPGNTGHSIPRFIAILIPFLNAAGWFSGIAFHDAMHFEVADETIKQWQQDGKFSI
ncbi:M15 family metallopeptidase [Flavitalea flava]